MTGCKLANGSNPKQNNISPTPDMHLSSTTKFTPNSLLCLMKFSDFYKPSPAQIQGELVFIGGGLTIMGYAAWKCL